MGEKAREKFRREVQKAKLTEALVAAEKDLATEKDFAAEKKVLILDIAEEYEYDLRKIIRNRNYITENWDLSVGEINFLIANIAIIEIAGMKSDIL